ncbi:MAG: hypothetical protein HQL46_09390 [Gammaproteobacteria bacterium]|nr:hypothetical protein [Gammaproteobacteria bacterium]
MKIFFTLAIWFLVSVNTWAHGQSSDSINCHSSGAGNCEQSNHQTKTAQ